MLVEASPLWIGVVGSNLIGKGSVLILRYKLVKKLCTDLMLRDPFNYSIYLDVSYLIGW